MNNGNAGTLKELTNKTTKHTNKGGGEQSGSQIKCANRSIASFAPPPSPSGFPSWVGSNPERTFADLFELAEQLYLKVRLEHLALPRTDQHADAVKILIRYLQKHNGDFETAATALRPFAEEADRRGIRQTNLCWLTEWAAAGQIPVASGSTPLSVPTAKPTNFAGPSEENKQAHQEYLAKYEYVKRIIGLERIRECLPDEIEALYDQLMQQVSEKEVDHDNL